MSYYPTPQPHPGCQQPGYPQQRPAQPQQSESNVTGLVGFIFSIVGLVTCGTLSPIGMLISIFGVGKRPRVFAMCGVFIGLAGTIIGLVIASIFGGLGVAGWGAADSTKRVHTTSSAGRDADRELLSLYRKKNNVAPTKAEGQAIADKHTDGWDNKLRYEPFNKGYKLTSAGPDGEFDTDDDYPLVEAR